jgi:hypothetical protein
MFSDVFEIAVRESGIVNRIFGVSRVKNKCLGTSVAKIDRHGHLLVPSAVAVELLMTHLTQHLRVHLGSMLCKESLVFAFPMFFALGLGKVNAINVDSSEYLEQKHGI